MTKCVSTARFHKVSPSSKKSLPTPPHSLRFAWSRWKSWNETKMPVTRAHRWTTALNQDSPEKKKKKKKKNSFRKTPRKTKRGSSFFFLFLFCYLPQLHASLQGGKGIDVLLTRIVGSRGQGKVSDVFYESRLHNVEKSSWALEE